MTEATRRGLLAASGAFLGGFATNGMVSTIAVANDSTLTVTALGGNWERALRSFFVPAFQRKTNAEVRLVPGTPAQWMAQIRAQASRTPLDAIDNNEILAVQLMESRRTIELTPANVPNLADVAPLFRDPWKNHGVLYSYAGAGFSYNKNKIPNPPKTWPEFFERAARGEFGRSIALPGINYPWTVSFLWLYASAFGGSIQNMDPAFNQLERIKPYIVKYWSNAVEIERILATGEADIAVFWDGRTHAMIDGGASHLGFQRPEGGSLIGSAVAQVVKGGNEALALEWVNTLLDPALQLEFFKMVQYAGTSSRLQYPGELGRRVLPIADGVLPPYTELARIVPALIARWNREVRL